MNKVANDIHLYLFLEKLYSDYKEPLLRAIRKYIGNLDVCEDIFHEVFIHIIQKASLLNSLPRQKMEAYIFLIARGISYDFLRKKYKHVQVDMSDETLHGLLDNENMRATSRAWEKIDLTFMMKEFTKEEQLLLFGKYYLGLSTDDLVKIVGGSSTAVRSKLFRARKRVFDKWTISGLTLEDFLNGSPNDQ